MKITGVETAVDELAVALYVVGRRSFRPTGYGRGGSRPSRRHVCYPEVTSRRAKTR
jgi:hypothetical protein